MFEASVVRIYATAQAPDYDVPWQARTPMSSTGSGVTIDSEHVLTGAHVVAHANFIQVQKVSDPNKYVARPVGISHDMDLALLRVEDARFAAKQHAVAELGELPQLRDRVSVVGFPVGGEEVSITEGVVSRIELQRYSHSQRYLLAVTVDAAINEGNSGGPVFHEGKVVGIAFQTLRDAEAVGEMVPVTLIRRFIEGIRAGRSQHVPSLSLRSQSLENPMLKRASGLSPEQTGVLVLGAEFGGSAHGVLEPGDVLLEVDGYQVEDNGTIRYLDRVRTRFEVVLADHFVGDQLAVAVMRGGERRELSLELKEKCYLVSRSACEESPRYFVYGGLVFQPLSRGYLETWARWWDKAPPEFLFHYYSGVRTEAQREVVVLTQILADELTMGYEDHSNEVVRRVNGVPPRDLADLVERLTTAGDVVEVEVACGARLLFETAKVREASSRILERYRVSRARSPSL
ncbi:MAG: trypsin-like peptidase domain-containing protein [Polyangiaceae bacterium]|nr:trypsin-like peptidase domain-containing protein [Polyangiaceae bacterium]MCW5790415.1 trypsin-like peptidase domain-containing protein [Polyangiaceae bacterium]